MLTLEADVRPAYQLDPGSALRVSSMSGVQDFHQLLASAVEGDRLALGQLLLARYDEIAERAKLVLRERGENGVAVEDLVQHTYVQAIRGIGGLQHRDESGFHAWLLAIAEHVTQNELLRRQRLKRGGERRLVAIPVDGAASSLMNLVSLVTDPHPSPGRPLAEEEAVRAIQVGIAALPDDQRAAVNLHHVNGKSIEDTAAELQRSPGAVRGLLQRARESLKTTLGNSSRWFDKKS